MMPILGLTPTQIHNSPHWIDINTQTPRQALPLSTPVIYGIYVKRNGLR
jgi:hypothetical protein